MRGLIFWVSSMALAFLVSAGAFLLLAELGSDLSGRKFSSGPQPENPGPPLVLNIGEEQLKKLESAPNQPLTIGIRNEGSKRLKNISVTLESAPEDTSSPEKHFYQATVKSLPAGEYKTIDFNLDLAFPDNSAKSSEQNLGIVEVRAVTPGGLSAVRTAVLPL